MKSHWSEKIASSLKGIDLLVYRSRLIGKEPGLVLWGGGNTSMKLDGILYVKGSGSDLKSCTATDFSPLPLEPLLEAEKRELLSDEEMVRLFQTHLLRLGAPRPSIETLMHAFIPYDHVDHSHADAIVSITNTKNNKEIFDRLYGKDLVWVPYTKSGFPLAKAVAAAFRKRPDCQGAILEKHGIFTWAKRGRESYETMIEMVTRAEEFIRQSLKEKGKKPLGQVDRQKWNQSQRKAIFAKIVPILKRIMKEEGLVSFQFRDSPDILEFVNSERGPEVSRRGPATPEHAMRIRRFSLFLKPSKSNDWKNEIEEAVRSYTKDYQAYFRRYASLQHQLQDTYPRVILIPQVGLISVGKDKKNARIVADIAQHTLQIMKNGMALGGYESLAEKEIFEMEYWQLELFKLSPQVQSEPAPFPPG